MSLEVPKESLRNLVKRIYEEHKEALAREDARREDRLKRTAAAFTEIANGLCAAFNKPGFELQPHLLLVDNKGRISRGEYAVPLKLVFMPQAVHGLHYGDIAPRNSSDKVYWAEIEWDRPGDFEDLYRFMTIDVTGSWATPVETMLHEATALLTKHILTFFHYKRNK
jgi:hypothetical protein